MMELTVSREGKTSQRGLNQQHESLELNDALRQIEKAIAIWVSREQLHTRMI